MVLSVVSVFYEFKGCFFIHEINFFSSHHHIYYHLGNSKYLVHFSKPLLIDGALSAINTLGEYFGLDCFNASNTNLKSSFCSLKDNANRMDEIFYHDGFSQIPRQDSFH